ncbi:AMP-binding protein [Desulfatibacillum aliphaticivorans]|uniref:AMP-binding protein n=1 Tax=Desulfatibacillum aliphaticivorans TaxID=218208 RepID=UPI00041EBA9D|nr:AMP-binding protein [Desulfatibacillum aliphaticivorans]
MDAMQAYISKPWLQHYPESAPHTIDIPEVSVPDLFNQVTEKFGKKTAVNFYGRNISYKELKDQADRFAAALDSMGIKKGDRVALYLLNCPQFIICYMGALMIGAVVTPVSPVYSSSEVRHQLTDSGAKVIVCQDFLYDNVIEAEVKLDKIILTGVNEYLPKLKKLFTKGILGKAYGGVEAPDSATMADQGLISLQDLLKKHSPNPPKVEIDPVNDLAALPYTGGTTGHPKAAMISHYTIVSCQAQAMEFWGHLLEEGNETVIAFLPLFHIYGQVIIMLTGLVHGFNLVLFTTPDLDKILNAMDQYQASAFYGVPTLFEYLKEYDKTNRVNWKKLKLVVCGADTLHDTTVEDWERRTGSRIIEGYGMTETAAASLANPPHRPKRGSFGIPLPNITAAIIDVDGTEAMPVGEVGELVLSGPSIMTGYWQRPDDNQETMVELAGMTWLRTGDLVKMDEEGYFYFFDRKRDLIKYKGYSVFAKHVEEVLYDHPQVKAAGVVGVPNPKVGQMIKAYVVLQAEARGKISEEEITEYCKTKLAHYKVPQIIEFRGELPKTDVGKVSRRELREEVEEA